MKTAVAHNVCLFSTESQPFDARLTTFQHAMETSFATGLVTRSRNRNVLNAEFRGYESQRLSFLSFRSSPISVTSMPSLRIPYALIVLPKHGDICVSQGGREAHVRPGTFFIADLAKPLKMENTDLHTHVVRIPTDSIRALVPQFDELTSVPIDVASGPGRLVRSLVDELVEQPADFGSPTTELVTNGLAQVVAAALTTHGAKDAIPSNMNASYMRSIMEFIKTHLREPTLNVDMIASGVNLSPTHVHRIFNASGTTLMRWVWNKRLDHCKDDLTNPSLRYRSIGEIAFAWGFNDAAHFSRSFHQRFGASPRALRQNALVGMPCIHDGRADAALR